MFFYQETQKLGTGTPSKKLFLTTGETEVCQWLKVRIDENQNVIFIVKFKVRFHVKLNMNYFKNCSIIGRKCSHSFSVFACGSYLLPFWDS